MGRPEVLERGWQRIVGMGFHSAFVAMFTAYLITLAPIAHADPGTGSEFAVHATPGVPQDRSPKGYAATTTAS